MISTALDIVAIGDAIVDVVVTCEDAFLEERGFAKGSHRLLSVDEANELYAAAGPGQQVSGGSAANSMEGAAALGLEVAFVGQVAADELGATFVRDMRSIGVRFATLPIKPPPQTGMCLIHVTPDAQRTMSTLPGASHELTKAAIDPELIRSASVTFLEGYLWQPQRPREAMLEAARIAHSAGRAVAFTLSEGLDLDSLRDGVHGMIQSGNVDILFGSEHEYRNLTGCQTTRECIAALAPFVETLVITRGADGAVAIHGGETVEVEATPVAALVDTTGAGDLFAAGFLAARLRGHPLLSSLEIGSRAAAHVIARIGARPAGDLRQLIQL